MKTYTLEEKKQIFTRWHIGRGGHYNNAGHRSFCGCENFRELVDLEINDGCDLITEDWDDEADKLVKFEDKDWRLVNRVGDTLLEGRDEIECETGSIDFDGIYNTDYVKTVDNLTAEEEEILVDGLDNCDYFNMSDELREYVKQELAPKYGKEVEDEC